MEFNSAPADPCSNTRRDNVWSEATSSESVEMLLKSDGQEEMMPAASIILAMSVCKDQGGSAGHVESGIDLDTRNSDTMGPKDEVHEDPTQDKPLDDQLLLVEVSSLNSENENPHNLTHNTLSGRSGISAIEGEHEPSDENVQEPKTIGCSKMVVLGASEALSQKNADVSLKICNESGYESHASTRTGIEDTVVLDGNTRKSSVDISDTPCFESRVENSVDTVAANLDCPKPEDSGSIPSNKECELLFPEGDEKTSPRASLQTGDLEIRTLTTSSNIPSRFGQHCVTSSRISDEMETDELAPHAESKVLVAVDDRPEDGKEKLSVIGFPISDNISGQDGVTKNPDTHLISGAASVLDVKADGDSGTSPLSEVAASPLKSVKKCNEMSSNKSPSPAHITFMDLDKQVNDIGCKKSNLLGSCDADIGCGSKHEITPVKSGGDHESAQPADTAGERSNLAPRGIRLTSNLQEMNVSRPSQPFANLKLLADAVLTSIGAEYDREMAEELLISFGAAIDREVPESRTTIDIEVAEAVADCIGATIDREVAEALAGERLALKRHLVASSQAVAMATVDVIEREIIDRHGLPSPIKFSKPDVALRPPPWAPKELQGDYLFVVTHVKAYLAGDEARQLEFLNHMRRVFKDDNMTLQDALDMFVIHGLWPDEKDCTRRRPILQKHFDARKMSDFKYNNKADYERFLKRWCSLSNISEDGTKSLVEHEFNSHGIYGTLKQENYLMSCIHWHEQIATRSRLSLIAEEKCAGTMVIKNIEYYRLSMKVIHDSLDRLSVPQRDIIIIRELGIDIILAFRYRLDCTMRYVFNLVGPNPSGYTDDYVFF